MQSQSNLNKKKTVKKILIAVAAVAAAAVLFFAGYFTYALTLDNGVRSLLWFKKMVQSDYYEEVSDEEFWQAAIDGVEGLLDRYSCYYTSEEYDAVVNSDKGIKTGTGMSFFSGTNKLYRVAINSPLFYTGKISAGMFLTGVGTTQQAISDTFTASAVDKAFAVFGEGDSVALRFSTKAADDTSECVTVTVQLKTYTESYVLYAANGKAYANIYEQDGSQGVWTDVSSYVTEDETFTGKTAYIRLASFSGNAAEEFDAAADQYVSDGNSVMLLDLRNDGGGKVSIMQKIASYFVKDTDEEKPVVMTAKYRDGKEEKYSASGNRYGEYFADSTIYVSANKNTASASEALIGAMISYGAIGYENVFITDTDAESDAPVTTYGKGIMQTTYYNPMLDEAVKLTTAQIYWPNGVCIHEKGISTADGARAVYSETFADYGDPELLKILQAIG